MNRAAEDTIKKELTDAIRACIQNTDVELPWLGDNIEEIMASAAMAVLRGMDDGQRYMAENDMLKKD